jgi:two-component system cell cycle sensor histidine kinase PleC
MREAQLVREIEERRTAETRALAEREKAQTAREQAEIERERAEIERERAEEANRAKSRFLSNVSHEIRTPLNSIVGFSELMHTQSLDDKVKAEYAGHVYDASRHLLALINDVLDIARIEAGKTTLTIEAVDAAEEGERAVAMIESLARAKQIDLRNDLAAGELPLRADRRVLVQMLLNLLSNAVNYTPAGGSVTVSGRKTGATVELSVADTGRGMSADQVERMLLPFERGDGPQDADDSSGTGLGLSLVKSLMEMHGGRLTIESEPGRGTRATLSFPEPQADKTNA